MSFTRTHRIGVAPARRPSSGASRALSRRPPTRPTTGCTPPERSSCPGALGRNNWLFAGSGRGGQPAAVLMSLCTTSKGLGIDPQAYLRDVLERNSTHPARRIEELLPDRWQTLRQSGDAATG